MPKVLNKYKDFIPKDAFYIGRPSKYGNPFSIGKDGTRADVVRKHREWLCDQPDLVASIVEELRGKDLVCFCSPLECHGDILLWVANME